MFKKSIKHLIKIINLGGKNGPVGLRQIETNYNDCKLIVQSTGGAQEWF